jgi:hypothetical protein
MPQTQRLLADAGATAENWYIHTPICSPSRSELVTGRYFHNIKAAGKNGGGYCSGMHVNYTHVNDNTFARVLKEEGNYTVGMFGKYLNEMPATVPPGFDAWLANGGGNYIAPAFMTQNIDGLPDGNWHGTAENYSTAVIGNTSIAWIRKVLAEDPNRPFMVRSGGGDRWLECPLLEQTMFRGGWGAINLSSNGCDECNQPRAVSYTVPLLRKHNTLTHTFPRSPTLTHALPHTPSHAFILPHMRSHRPFPPPPPLTGVHRPESRPRTVHPRPVASRPLGPVLAGPRATDTQLELFLLRLR